MAKCPRRQPRPQATINHAFTALNALSLGGFLSRLRIGCSRMPPWSKLFVTKARLSELTLLLLVCLSPWAFGSVEAWAELGLYGGIAS